MGRFWLICYALVTWKYQLIVCVQVEEPIIHHENLAAQLGTMKNTVKVLSDQWEKWNTLFITSLEPRITSTASTLSSIDSNIHNLQERAHVWDTFQLHVAAWNDQLATMDRKIDILNKAIEQVTILDSKMNTMLSGEYKLDKLIKMTNSMLEGVLNIESGIKSKQSCKPARDSLFEEFAARGILSSLKLVERKVDQLLSSRQNDNARPVNEQPAVKCVVPKAIENLVKDISSKVDIIFDSVTKPNEVDYSDEYLDAKDIEGSGNAGAAFFQKVSSHKRNLYLQQNNGVCKSLHQGIKTINEKFSNVDQRLVTLLRSNQIRSSDEARNTISRDELLNMLKQFLKDISVNQTRNINLILDSYFHEDKVHWSTMFNTLSEKCLSGPKYVESTEAIGDSTTTSLPDINAFTENIYTTSSYQSDAKTRPFFDELLDTSPPTAVNKSSCSELDQESPSGIYVFRNGLGDFVNERFFNKQFCEMRVDGLWTVIQRRDNYSIQQDFNVSWHDYKLGFGNLQKDFWIGNNYLSRLSKNNNLTLRIELQDFDGNNVWAEYKTFKVASEKQKFQLTVGGYSGNASDAFSSHNGSPFSTYDRKNDYAPECCPCSVSYGGGWWFNRCFESNLNGIYYKKPFENDYFRGIIWEHWLGNYSLKKSIMMVKATGSTQFFSNFNDTKFEDP